MDFSPSDRFPAPTNCSNKDRINSDFSIMGFLSFYRAESISSAFKGYGRCRNGDHFPFSASTKEPNSGLDLNETSHFRRQGKVRHDLFFLLLRNSFPELLTHPIGKSFRAPEVSDLPPLAYFCSPHSAHSKYHPAVLISWYGTGSILAVDSVVSVCRALIFDAIRQYRIQAIHLLPLQSCHLAQMLSCHG